MKYLVLFFMVTFWPITWWLSGNDLTVRSFDLACTYAVTVIFSAVGIIFYKILGELK